MARKREANVERLVSLIERVERLEEERKSLAEDIKSIFAEAKSAGFDPKVIKQMIRERKMAPGERVEWEALCEAYRAALGMLDGTPLGDAARKRFDARRPADDAAPADPLDDPPPSDAPAPPTAEDVLRAKAEGAAAQKAGRRVVENPYAAGDARRAAWDEGWCASGASDGMDIPDAWRRAAPRKPKKGEGDKGAGA